MRNDSNVLPAGQTRSAEGDRRRGVPLTWTIAEAAEKLGVSRSYYYRAAGRGELPVKRLGRRLVVPKLALLRLLEEFGPLTPAMSDRDGEVA